MSVIEVHHYDESAPRQPGRGWWNMRCWNGLSTEQQRRLIEVGNLPMGYEPDGACTRGATIAIETQEDEALGPRFYCGPCAHDYMGGQMMIHDELNEVLDTFQWAYPDRTENRGEITVEGNELVLQVWCRDNDDEDNEVLKPLDVRVTIRDGESARDQIRSMIHQYLCHEADEQMWFGDERPFHPHQVMAS